MVENRNFSTSIVFNVGLEFRRLVQVLKLGDRLTDRHDHYTKSHCFYLYRTTVQLYFEVQRTEEYNFTSTCGTKHRTARKII